MESSLDLCVNYSTCRITIHMLQQKKQKTEELALC